MKFITDFIMPFVNAFIAFIKAVPTVDFGGKEEFEGGEEPYYVETSRLFHNGYSFKDADTEEAVVGIVNETEEGIENRTFFFLFILGLNLFWKLTTGALLMYPGWIILIGWVIWYFNKDERSKAVSKVTPLKFKTA